MDAAAAIAQAASSSSGASGLGVGVWLAAFGGVLLGETIVVLTLYWRDPRRVRLHVLAISASYLILVALAMQPALRISLEPHVHIGLAVLAYVLGAWALWELVPRAIERERVTSEPLKRGGSHG